ncbi:Hypothetical Protein FCC1311_106722 [Hondaea fermentalgiana]|uniref:Uncharacterized protein n=1 Tax=Hondaea fermentalgiana TaxID=2315210 RepID=A0A2R5GXD7_9STRA|nr:Hypothetical Protein FCC1311_106722 [Hondaea fermentalgiana]|eukprot:GBG34448.1 Hypothetical Protein FCC1311_106722 [Hondaea fermentalgiana]
MRQSKDPETFVSVYENNQTTHIRLMAVFSLSQAVYWTALSADAFLAPALGVPSRLTPSPEMLEGISDTMGFYTDPAWILFGGLTSIACSVLTRLYAHANIGRMAIKDASGEVQLRGHTFFGNLKGPETFAIRDVEITAPSQRQRYYMVKVPTKSWNMLLDSKGDFFDLYQAAAGTDPTSGQEAVDTHRRSVMTRLGVSYGGVGLSGNVLPGSTATSASDNSGSTADTAEDSSPGPKSMQPPSLEEIRAARLKRQGRKL